MSEKNDAAIATPTKRFFVSMLTRDISLTDAILDLIDNCLDGALRSFGSVEEIDYSRFFVKLVLSDKAFEITDNCGGIPRKVAKNYAFRFGRESDDDRDVNDETIGMYGVGMKRALFKMGRDSSVNTRYNDDCFQVSIPSAWLDDKSWDSLPIKEMAKSESLEEPGTVIKVTNLHSFVEREFTSDSFTNELKQAIAEHFTYFLQKGLKVILNDSEIEPVYVEVLTIDDPEAKASPFVYEKTIDDVLVRVVVGVNSRIRRDDGDSVQDHSAKSTSGWSVFCNNRAVVVGDYSRLTWSPKLPRYHDQYNIITGIVEFNSKNADKLPVSTTKRDLDSNSDLWWEAQKWMYEGMRLFIDYTNKWKNHTVEDRKKVWDNAKPMSAENAVIAVSKKEAINKDKTKVYFNPKKNAAFPEPENSSKTARRIIFSRPQEEVKKLSNWFFEMDSESPGRVGEECFLRVLAQVDSEDE